MHKNKKEYDFIFSLGLACSGSYFLRKCNFQVYSLPFDWLFGSCFLNRIKTIENNFKDWLNIEDLELTDTRLDFEPRNIFHNKKTDITFKHDFPVNKDWQESYESVSKKYQRRINRLYNSIKKAKKILLFYIINPNDNAIDTNEEILEGYQILKNKFKDKEIDILYLYNDINEKNPKIIHLNEHIKKVCFDYSKASDNDLNFALNKTLITNFLKKHIRYKMPLKERLSLILRVKKIKRGLRINLFLKLNTIFRLCVYLFGLRLDFCLGKLRDIKFD